ncbi:MAG TPA: hypothetical protein V6D22_00820 [Candidatus Obscuribacterales bacterium]
MRYTLDITELTLIDLLDLMSQEALGVVQLDDENANTLHTAAWQRARSVDQLERVFFDELNHNDKA